MAKRDRTVKNPVQKGRITIGEARSAARSVRERSRSAVTGRYAKRALNAGGSTKQLSPKSKSPKK